MRKCHVCGRTDHIERHHVFEGPCRKLSTKHGMVVDLCHDCHNEPPDGVHHNAANDLRLKREYQELWMYRNNADEDDFRKIFGKSYLEG